MESNEDMVMIPRLNALVRQTDLRIAILEAIQKMGYDRPSENQALAINHFARGNDVFLSLPTGSGKSLCYAAIPGVFDTLKRRANIASEHHSIAVVVSPLSSLMQDQVHKNTFVGVCVCDQSLTVLFLGKVFRSQRY